MKSKSDLHIWPQGSDSKLEGGQGKGSEERYIRMSFIKMHIIFPYPTMRTAYWGEPLYCITESYSLDVLGTFKNETIQFHLALSLINYLSTLIMKYYLLRQSWKTQE